MLGHQVVAARSAATAGVVAAGPRHKSVALGRREIMAARVLPLIETAVVAAVDLVPLVGMLELPALLEGTGEVG